MNVDMWNDIERMVTSIGFPMCMCFFMWRKITDSDEKQTQLLNELTISIRNLTEILKDR